MILLWHVKLQVHLHTTMKCLWWFHTRHTLHALSPKSWNFTFFASGSSLSSLVEVLETEPPSRPMRRLTQQASWNHLILTLDSGLRNPTKSWGNLEAPKKGVENDSVNFTLFGSSQLVLTSLESNLITSNQGASFPVLPLPDQPKCCTQAVSCKKRVSNVVLKCWNDFHVLHLKVGNVLVGSLIQAI